MTRTLGSVRKLPTPTATTQFLSGARSFVLNTNLNRQLFEHEPALALRTLLPSRALAQVRQEPWSELWFTPSRPARSPADDLLGDSGRPGSNGDHKPPDERSLKLGKSGFCPASLGSLSLILYSSPHPLSAATKYPYSAPSARNPFPQHLPPSLPVDTSPSSRRQGQSSLPRRLVDGSGSMGLRASSRQRQTPGPLRKDCSDGIPIATTTRRRIEIRPWRRKVGGAMEDGEERQKRDFTPRRHIRHRPG